MSKAVSFYDWSLSLKHKSDNEQEFQKENVNSLGLTEDNFKDFMKKWKEKNLV
jgi:hypothetical protein